MGFQKKCFKLAHSDPPADSAETSDVFFQRRLMRNDRYVFPFVIMSRTLN